jgi:phytoene dehydrogenase-like protein
MNNQSAIVVGAGILGLATAKALAEKGYKVTVIEKSQF